MYHCFFRRHVCLSNLKHAPSRELPLTARKTVFSHLKRKHSTCSRHSNIDIGAIGQSSPGIFTKNIKAREFIISIKTEILFKINLMFRKLYIYRLLAGVAVETLLANETLLVEMLLSKRQREALSHP